VIVRMNSFLFQAEDGIRDRNVTGVQTCALPISESDRRRIEPFRWGLLPFWAKEKKMGYSLINARSETIDSKKSYKHYVKNQRCLIPASRFYEWKGEKANKTPFYVHPTQEPIFAFA